MEKKKVAKELIVKQVSAPGRKVKVAKVGKVDNKLPNVAVYKLAKAVEVDMAVEAMDEVVEVPEKALLKTFHFTASFDRL
jgi:hypothetical protein